MSLNMSVLNPFYFHVLKQNANMPNYRSVITGYGKEVPHAKGENIR